MAKFTGTIEEFMKFMGSYCRIKVMYITRKYRQQVGRCEACNSDTKPLEAAHVRGKERPLLISNILNNYVEGESVIVDLQEFDNLFIAAHEPFDSTIRILCKECHRKYDSIKPFPEYILEEQEANIESCEVKEAETVVRLIKNASMNKGMAMQLIYEKAKTKLNSENTIFSNINAAKDVWWLEPTNKKFNFELNFILNHSNSKKLYHFRMPAGTIKNPHATFYQRNDKPYSKIYIPISNSKFVDCKGFNFTPFLVNEIPY